jgi:tetratricopeptide (TPR) repeat protein
MPSLVLCLTLLLSLAPVPDTPATLTETAPATPTETALDLAHHARPIEAWDLLLDHLIVSVVGAGPWDDDLAVAEAEVGALLLGQLTRQLDRFPEVAELLMINRPWPRTTPPRVAYLLDELLADALRRTGKSDLARMVIDDQVVVTDWYLAGPFDNERGSGFDVVYPPEQAFDVEAEMPGKERPVRWRLNPGRHHPLGQIHLDDVLRPESQAVAYLATALKPLEPGPITLRLGTTCSFKVFHDGHEVAARKLERPLRADQDLVTLDLHGDWNQILIKLAVEDGPWQVLARLTHPDGTPARRVEPRSAFTAWPGPPPHPDFIMWWELEDDPWTVEALAGLGPDQAWGDAHEGHGHDDDEGWPADDEGDEGGGPPGGDDEGDDGGWPPGGDDEDGDGGFAVPEPPPPPADWVWPRPQRSLPQIPSPREASTLLAGVAADATTARLASLWNLMVHPGDRVDRDALPHAHRAVGLEGDNVLGRYLVALADRVAGQSRNEREVNTRLDALEEVLARDPGHVAALLDLADFATLDNPRPDRAGELLLAAERAAPESWRVLQARIDHLESRRRGADAEVLRRRAEASAEAGTRVAGLLARSRRAAHLGDTDAALRLLQEAWARDHLNTSAADDLVEAYSDRGELNAALFVVELSQQAEPFDLRRMVHAARRFEHEQDLWLHRGRELLTRAMDVCRENTSVLADLVRMELTRDDARSAKLVLEELLRLDPGDAAARRHLGLLTDEEVERFEEPYRWDARGLEGLPLPESGNDPFEVLDRTVVWRVHPDGTEHRYEHVALRVLNDSGARALDSWPVSAGAGARLHVHEMRVIRADGSVEPATVPRGSRSRARRYDLPPLATGDVVDAEWRSDQLRADVFGEYFGTRHAFYPDRPDALAPTRRSELVVIAPDEVPLYVAGRNVDGLEHSSSTDADGHRVLRWIARDLARPSLETAMPGRQELAPVIDLTTFRDWQAFATWYWSFIEKEFVTTDAMRVKVAELTEGLGSEREQVEAIARFVGQEIRYNAWAFGTHGYEPYSASTIFDRRFGDCKDKSILLRQLLAEVGVEAIPVLIKAEWQRADEPLGAAMVGQFNHCIAWLPPTHERDGYYLDATADLNPVEYLRADDQGARVLHVSPDGGSLHDIPYAPPSENTRMRSWDVTLSPGGDAQITLTDGSNGHFGVILRSRYGGQQGAVSELLARELAEAFGPVNVEEVVTSDLEDITLPARLAARFGTSGLWTREGDLVTLPAGFDGIGLDGLATEPPDARSYELVLDRPFAHDSEIVYHLPDGARLIEPPAPVEVEAEGLLRYRREVTEDGDGVRVHRVFELLDRRITLPDYARFREALRAVEQAERVPLRVHPGSTD